MRSVTFSIPTDIPRNGRTWVEFEALARSLYFEHTSTPMGMQGKAVALSLDIYSQLGLEGHDSWSIFRRIAIHLTKARILRSFDYYCSYASIRLADNPHIDVTITEKDR